MPQDGRETLISLREVGLRYRRHHRIFSRRDEHWALTDIHLDIFRGEALGVIGRNGSGKSSLLRLLAGILKPDRGSLTMAQGHNAALLSLQLGFMPNLSGRDNAILSGMFMGFTKREMKAKLPHIEALAELGPAFAEPVNTYSAGMRARLGFAAAYQVEPDILLLDEVLGVGDEKFRKKSEALLRAKMETDRTVVLVSHSAETIKKLCDRVVWLEQGRVREVGEPPSVMARYEDWRPASKSAAPVS